MRQFIRFCIVGTIVFLIDALVFSAALALNIPTVLARCVSLAIALLSSWMLNRSYTFQDRRAANWQGFILFGSTQLVGAGVNAITSLSLYSIWSLTHIYPWIAIAVGSIAGLAVNFSTAKFIAFGNRSTKIP